MMQDASKSAIQQCLAGIESDHYSMGPGWTAAHDICQAHEGEPIFDRIHALIHRIEGDHANARYWYRRAGVPAFEGGFAEEAESIGGDAGLNAG
jgi:hypothetical protein